MTPQHQAGGRSVQAVATTIDLECPHNYSINHARKINDSGSHPSGAKGLALAQDNFEDSRFIDASDNDHPTTGTNAYEDFILYDSDTPFIDEEASTTPNHGSIYNGNSNSQTAYRPKYTSYGPPDHSENLQPMADLTQTAHSVENLYEASRSPERCSLFGEFKLVPTGPSMLNEWSITPHRHEDMASHFEQLSRYTPDSGSPASSSPRSRHRRRKSGKKHPKH
ncbi:uncharacterized protein BP5553_08208 [Venustampulla echinocandica]|uniref:Uncharacterized protein n=1 Tax=Venustampulla echinocandica TaxID=2656787 RepID=A0A370TG21_9HELO|nr:uncharacterized protein BP5553_08208 [Venustampulla echinocandica]RDL33840.1 hypothetical protein BP5553_08208 [Venustampulla echinocandica]